VLRLGSSIGTSSVEWGNVDVVSPPWVGNSNFTLSLVSYGSPKPVEEIVDSYPGENIADSLNVWPTVSSAWVL